MTELAHIAARRTGFRNRRETLLVSAAIGAALAVMPSGGVEAQTANFFGAFRGTPSVNPDQVTITNSTNTTTVTMKAPVATINWTPFDNEGSGPIDFLPQGTTGIFQNDVNLQTGFAVLNRIVPANASRRVDFNGRVVSQLRDSAGAITGPGGSVAFYAPGGIFVSSTAVFDVGSLLLTTLDPVRDGSGNFVNPQTGNLSLRGAAGSTAAVVTAQGSQINAPANASTVAMVAAQVIHNGAVRVNGSAAYIAAESVDVVVNNGLFDINILTGTPVANAIQHTGSTGGPAATSATDNQIIYMVAVPKNQAITMTLQGSAGFDAATAATVENGEIILSAGHNVSGRTIATNPVAVTDPATGQPLLADALINGGTYTSDVRARATGTAAARTTAEVDATFNQDVTVIGSQRAEIGASAGRTLTVLGNATVSNARGDSFGANQSGSGSGSVPTFGNDALINANGVNSFVDIRGTATLDASVRGTQAADATGGRAEIFALAGRVEIDGAVSLNATGLAGATTTGQDGPNGTGGRAAVLASGSGTITLGATANVVANGTGGVRQGGTDSASGTGLGGMALVEGTTGGAVTIAGAANVSASGSGGPSFAPGNGGQGTGGNALIVADNNGTVNIGSGSTVNANGTGGTMSQGQGNSGGDGQGGRAQLLALSGGTVNSTGNLFVTSIGVGGGGVVANGGNGGTGRGGFANMAAVDGRVNFGTASISASGTGGIGATGGNAFGGSNPQVTETSNLGAFVSARRGTLSGTNVTVEASAVGGAGGTGAGGSATGGGAAVTAFNGSAIGDDVAADGPSLVDIDFVTVKADARGGNGGLSGQGVGQTGGSARGGSANLTAQAINGTLDVVSANVTANAIGGRGGNANNGGLSGGTGGSAAGGSINLGQVSGNSDTPSAPKAGLARFGNVFANASGTGGDGGNGGSTGGNGTGGTGGNGAGGAIFFLARGANLTVTNGATLNAFGTGGFGGLRADQLARGESGRGAGGDVGAYFTPFFDSTTQTVTNFGATVNIGQLSMNSQSGRPSIAADGTVNFDVDQYGTVQLEVTRSTASIGSADILAFGTAPRDLVALGITGAAVSPTPGPSGVRVDNGTLTFGGSEGGLFLQSPADLTLRAIGTGTIRAASFIGVISDGTVNLLHDEAPAGAVAFAAPSLFFDSQNINIAADVGNENTNNISFGTSAGGQVVTIGGEGEGPGYTLTQSEASRLTADFVSFEASSSEDGPEAQMVIRDLTLTGTAGGDGTAAVGVEVEGSVRVEGQINYVNAAASDTLVIDADNRIEVITPTGGIRMTAPDGKLSGLLALNSRNIVVADASLAAQLRENPNFEGRTQALRTNNGAVNPLGYVQAGGIRIGYSVDDEDLGTTFTTFVQNTGTATDFGGLTVGAAGLSFDIEAEDVSSSGALPEVDMVAFGRRQNPDGSFTTGAEFFSTIDFRGDDPDDPSDPPVTYTAASEFNGINVNEGPTTPPPPPPGRGAFAGTPSFNEAQVAIARGDALDTITVKAPTAIINWTPTDNQGTGPINFLPQGHTGIFQNDTAITNFAVLNRIVPADASRRVDFNGRVVSQLRDASGNVTGPGGTVAFYSPGGIFVSGTAVFDVGSLLLTSLDPVLGDNGFSGSAFNLRGASGSTAPVIVAQGAQINALANGSYVALVGPRIQQDGVVRVRGSAAYVAGESVDMTVNNGLFDIRVLTGTSVAGNLTGTPETNAIWHTGSTGGPLVTGADQRNRIYMVAVPKNELITMFLRGQIGFDAIAGSMNQNGQVILSAGYNVTRPNSTVPEPGINTFPEVPQLARINIASGASFTSSIIGGASQNADARGNLSFAGDVLLRGRTGANLIADTGQSVTVAGSAFVISDDIRPFTVANANVTRELNTQGGAAQIGAFEGNVNIAGSAVVSARASAANNSITNEAGSAVGGTAQILVTGGQLTVGGNTFVDASAVGAVATGDGTGGAATGGQASVQIRPSASGATGTANFAALTVNANGSGGGGATGGAATGGRAVLFTPGGTMNVGGALSVSATGSGGAGANGGAGTGGRVEFTSTNGGVLNFGAANLNASGFGGIASDNAGSGAAQGGNVVVATRGTAGGQINGGDTIIFVDGITNAGSGGSSDANATAGTGQVDADTGSIGFARLEISSDGVANGSGTGTGGTAQVLGNGGAITIAGISGTTAPALNLTAIGVSNNARQGAAGGAGIGGRTTLTAQNGSTIATPTAFLNAGGIGGANLAGGIGATGTGGTALLTANGGTINAGSATVGANGNGGAGVTGGEGRGGSATASATNSGRLNLQAASQILANGSGGAGTTGAGGLGQGGSANLAANGGTIAALDPTVAADGVGGAGATGGAGTGGVALISDRNSQTLTLTGTATVRANGTGGNALGGGVGGVGRGGQSELFSVGGAVTGVNAVIRSDGRGGNGGTGGAGFGGAGVLGSRGSDTIATQAGTLTLTGTATGSASGFGGTGAAGGAGGAAQGGSFLVAGGSSAGTGSLNTQTVNVAATAVGGAGGTGVQSATGGAGGTATGGSVTLLNQPANGTLRIAVATADAGATGGAGGAGGTGGRGGDATGGTADVQVTNTTTGTATATGTANIGSLAASASAIGGAGGAGAAAAQGGAGGQGTGGASRITLRGGSLTGGATQLVANGTGGASTAAGGIGSGGTAAISVAPRQGVTETQTLTLGVLTMAASGTGGAGATAGAARFGTSSIEATGSTATFASTSMAAGGTSPRVTGETSAGPSIIRADNSTVNLGQTANITGGGGLNFAAAGTGSIRSSGSITATSGGLIAVTHDSPAANANTLVAPTISLISANLNIAEGATVGAAGTTTGVNLTAVPNGRQVVVGGTDEGQGYTLTQAEIGRIRGTALNFATAAVSSDANRGADLLIRALTLNGSASNGFSTVTFNTPGRVRVEGAVAMNGAAATDRLAITGTERLEVITPSGSITMRDASNQLSGVLQLMSDNIVVTEGALANQLAANPNFEGRDQALRTNNGAATPAGFVQAGGVQLLSGGRIFVQNTGTATEFAGVTVGGGGLLIGRMIPTQTPGNPGNPGQPTTSFSFVGTLQTANEVLFFDFTVTGQSQVTLRSYSYAGGTNAQGRAVAAGGFDPILALFNAAGALIDQNDDGPSGTVPIDPSTGVAFDVFLQRTLQPGNYKVAVSAFPNFAVGPNLTNGFQGATTLNDRSANFAFDVLGASTATGPGQGTPPPPAAPITAIAFGRQQNANGSFTSGAQFFEQLGFNNSNASATFASGSSFNNLTIGQAVPVPPPPTPQPPPPPPASPPPPVSGSEVIIGPITAAAAGTSGQDDGDGDGGPGSGFGAGFIGIVDTGQIANESLIEDPVASGGDSTLWTDGEDDDDEEDDETPVVEGIEP